MTPPVPAVLAEIAGLALRNAMPDVHPADRASSLGLSALLLGMAAEVWDGTAARLVEENRAIRLLLARAGEVGLDFAALVVGSDEDLRISALKASNGDLRAEQGVGRYIKRPAFGANFQAVQKRAQDLAPTAVSRG